MKTRIRVSALFGVKLHKHLRGLVSFCEKRILVKNSVFNRSLAYFEAKKSFSLCRTTIDFLVLKFSVFAVFN